MYKKILAAWLAAGITIYHANAQCLGSCCCAANISAASQAMSIPQKGEWLAGLSALTMQYKPLSDEELLTWAQPNSSVFSVNSQWTIKASVTYGISEKFSVSAMVPYNYSIGNKEGHYHADGTVEIHTYGNIRGPGDGSVILSYKFLDKSEKGWKAFVGAGIKIPTGKTDASSTYEVILPVHLQPGTGSWDPLATLSASKEIGGWTMQSQALVHIATTALEHNMGNYVRVDADASHEMITSPGKSVTSLLLLGGFAGEYNSPMKFSGNHDHDGGPQPVADSTSALVTFPNSGFTRVSAEAVMRCTLFNHLIIPLQFSLPIWQHLEGHQASLDWSASAGLLYSF